MKKAAASPAASLQELDNRPKSHKSADQHHQPEN
jgi:hypothetical protein